MKKNKKMKVFLLTSLIKLIYQILINLSRLCLVYGRSNVLELEGCY
jgi:hypothetical protein